MHQNVFAAIPPERNGTSAFGTSIDVNARV